MPKQFITTTNILIARRMMMDMEILEETTEIKVRQIPTDTRMEIVSINTITQPPVQTDTIMVILLTIINKD